MTTIILTRHGHVEWHAPERFRERADLPLTEHGVEQARAASRRIGAMWQVTAVYSSPMRCSRRTAQIIAEPFSLDAQPVDAMTDMDYGEWQGLTPEEREAAGPRRSISGIAGRTWCESPAARRLQDVLARVAHVLRIVVDRHPEDTVVLVGHDSVNRVILLHALELPLSRYWLLAQAPCAINRITAARDDFLVQSVNETCHLDVGSPGA